MVSHVKTEKKIDAGGVGIEAVALKERDQTNVWWHDAFSGALNNLDVGKKSKKSKKAKKEAKKQSSAGVDQDGEGGVELESTEVPTFEELFKATGGARLGMRARRKQTGKLERADHVKLDNNSTQPGDDATTAKAACSESEQAKKILRKEEKKRLKRERYEANQAEEEGAAAAARAAAVQKRQKTEATSSEEESKSAEKREKKKKKEKKSRKE